MFLLMSRNSAVDIAVKNSVVDGSKCVRIGTRNVAPNMAMTCWAPMPMVRVQVSRSSGSTTSPGASVLPSPCSFHVNRFPITNSFGSLRWHIYAAMCRVEAIVTRSPTVANEPHTARDSSSQR